MARTITTDAISYIRNLFIDEDPILNGIRESAPNGKGDIQISPEEGKLIYLLLKLMGASTVLEIGTLVGYSTLWIAKALPAYGRVISIEKSIEHYNIAQSNLMQLAEYDKMELINDDALHLEKYIGSRTLDAVFIDASKQHYPKYLELSYPFLKDGGLVIADNTFLFGSVFDDSIVVPKKLKEAIQYFNLLISDSDRFESIILPTSEGLSLAIKKSPNADLIPIFR